jgi:hypothetical protein
VTQQTDERESLTLKWGALKSWRLRQPATKALIERYMSFGSLWSAARQNDTPEQKQIICDIIDAGDFDTVLLDWDDTNVSKEEAKEYILNYGKR